MKKKLGLGVILFCTLWGISSAQSFEERKKQLPGWDWQLQSWAETGRWYGAEVSRAYDYLKSQGLEAKTKTVVAIIDGGADITHEDLQASLWTNRGEIAGNGIDDDGNGYVDDIHGWDFAGKSDGTPLNHGSLEADREYLRLFPKFHGADTTRLSKKEYAEYRYFKDEVEPASSIPPAYQKIAEAEVAEKYITVFQNEMKAKYPERKLFTLKEFVAIMDDNETDKDRVRAYDYLRGLMRFETWPLVYNRRNKLAQEAREAYWAKIGSVWTSEVERTTLGDDQTKASERFYGNNDLYGEISSLHGMHVGGIVGATRNNHIGIDGVADVELMFIRLSEGDGDERDKDVSSAIRYAVDNGARVINMSFGKRFSPQWEMVADAMRYAEKKGVLLIHAAGNDGLSVEEDLIYPTKHLPSGKTLKNWICVGSIASNGHPAASSNYGKTEVDVFAPGDGINSTVPHNGYRNFKGTSMAAPVVSGIAALVWNYFPELTMEEVRRAVLEGVTKRTGEEVMSPGLRRNRGTVKFEELCSTAGVVNALGAVKVAEKISKDKK